MKRGLASQRAFTLTELLVSIVGIILLAALSYLGMGQYRERATGYRCVANLRQIGAASILYAADHRNELPYYHYFTSPGESGSGASTGTWAYNLAPYLGIPRTEVTGAWASTERTLLGTTSQPIGAPCVLTCPGHRKTESTLWWAPHPMSWPTRNPISYAPPLEARGSLSERGKAGPSRHWTGIEYYPIRLSDIPYPGKKIWISDSPIPSMLNTVSTRWQDATVYKENWARQAFTRHNNGGNALFFDGHVEWLPLKTFTSSPHGPLEQRVRLYFNTFRNPADDL